MVIKKTQYAIRKTQSLRNKRILITAGPTWVPIDKVRVISNIATGETGILLAEKLQRLGAKVTLLLGPVEACCLNHKIRLIHFRFFEELKSIIKKELKSKKYDAVIHSAAVSDYRPQVRHAQKIKSDKKIWRFNLVPTPKIIDSIKKIDSSIFLVGFKFEPGIKKEALINKTKSLIRHANLDLAVANGIDKSGYQAYIVGKNIIFGPILNKNNLVNRLIEAIKIETE